MNNIQNIDCLDGLRSLPDVSVHCCVTSPPYYGLRDYGVDGQLGLEKTPEEYVAKMVEVFREVRRVLRDDGTLWLNLGDSYARNPQRETDPEKNGGFHTRNGSIGTAASSRNNRGIPSGMKAKDLIGIPWMVAFALRADGWYLRQDIIWAKKNCMPESVTDRCTKSHEYIFMFSKSSKYYYDQEAIKEPAAYDVDGTGTQARKARQNGENKVQAGATNGIRAGLKDARLMNGKNRVYDEDWQNKRRANGERQPGFKSWDTLTKEEQTTGMRNKRDVWFISPAQFPEAHFATFPEEIPAICIKAGCPRDGIVLDPFMGAGTTALVARKLDRNFIGFEINPEYIKLAGRRIQKELGMFV